MLWGTAITLDVRDAVSVDAADRVFRFFQHVDDLFSTWREDSEISRFACGQLPWTRLSHEVREVLEMCERLRAESGGAFDIRVGADPRVPKRPGLGPIDPSGMVKGWALERAADMLRADGAYNFTINAGGDVIAVGQPRPGRPWRIGIQHPWERTKVAAVVEVNDLGIATSGRYERGDHTIDPRSGAPAIGLMSVTVIGPDLALADGHATAALVLGEEGLNWLSGRAAAAMAITNDHTVILVNDFDRYRADQ